MSGELKGVKMARRFNMEMAHKLCDDVHGSGLDTEPRIAQSDRNITIRWDFHLMDDYGFYCGYWRFIVWIPKADPLGFRITGRRGNPRGRAAYGLKDYLEEVFAEAVAKVLDEDAVLGDGKVKEGGGKV
jgi:hypothetical protein